MEGSIALDKLASGQALAILREVQKDVVGKDMAIVKVLMVIVARGHILLEDMPGVGKTTLALAFSKALALDYKRMQFNPDVMPSDITGFSVYDRTGGVLEFKPGAILCNLFLADEINRASSRTQAALLEAMEEGSVTVDGVTHRIPEPFVVIATQNPTGASGTQLLPDSQLDRFMVRFSLGYPAPADELEMLRRKHGSQPVEPVQQVAEGADILRMRQEVRQVYVSDEIYDYVIRLINATRQHPLIGQGKPAGIHRRSPVGPGGSLAPRARFCHSPGCGGAVQRRGEPSAAAEPTGQGPRRYQPPAGPRDLGADAGPQTEVRLC